MSEATRTKLLEGALRTLAEQGIAKTSARTIAATAGVNQALVFYHFGSVDELLSAAVRYGAEQRVAIYRERLAEVGSLAELLAFGREMHEVEREEGHVAVLGQLLMRRADGRASRSRHHGGAGSVDHGDRTGPGAGARADPFGEFTDPAGLARAVTASFVGIELYEGVDPAGSRAALDALEQLAALVTALDTLGPVAQRAVRHHLRRTPRG